MDNYGRISFGVTIVQLTVNEDCVDLKMHRYGRAGYLIMQIQCDLHKLKKMNFFNNVKCKRHGLHYTI